MNQYPWWRYALLAVLIVVGVIYALPNLYGDDPALQVSSQQGVISKEVTKRLTAALKQHDIHVKSLTKTSDHSLLFRFDHTDAQLKAQDLIEAKLGNTYTVALNLAPRTPGWLLSLGAVPMKLGLDLRGGIHFLLKVDVNAMMKERMDGDRHSMAERLQEKRIRYSRISITGPQSLRISFRHKEALTQALALLTKQYQDYDFFQRRSPEQGITLKAIMRPASVIKLKQYAVSQNIRIMRQRVDALGIAEPIIQQQGLDQISVDLPGVQDTARAKSIVGKVATVRLQLEDLEHDPQLAKSSGIVPFGSQLFSFKGRPVLLKQQVVLKGSSITDATAALDENGQPAVSVRLSGEGVSYFNEITGKNVGKPMATIYVETKTQKKLVNKKVITQTHKSEKIINIATIQSALGNNFQISGLESMRSAQNLALLLRSGAYVAPVSFVQEQVVGPSLGKSNIRKGVLSTEIGALLVIIFMLCYYRFFGFVANLALLLNVIFILAVMSLIHATMTLPGIAAIVLTVGMAVDANVLINERIREELRNGMSIQASIHAGYERAFMTIVDANVTTLIVALVLYALGTGAVKGFAVTLIIGLLTSMITAIFFTRAVINLTYGQRQLKQLSIGIKVKA